MFTETSTNFFELSFIFIKLHSHRAKAQNIPSARGTLTLAKLSNRRISQTNQILLALHLEVSTKTNHFQGSRVRGQQKLRIPETPSDLTVETSTHIENTVGAQFIFDSLGFFSVVLWAATCTTPDQFRKFHLFCFLLVVNWLNSTCEEKREWASLFSHCYRLHQSQYLPHLVSSPLKMTIWNGFLCKQGCVIQRDVQVVREGQQIVENLGEGRHLPLEYLPDLRKLAAR